MEKRPHRDLSIDGPGSPVSLKKFLENEEHYKNPYQDGDRNEDVVNQSRRAPDPKVLIAGVEGIAFDDPSVLVMMSEDRIQQATWFREEVFANKFYNSENIPAYLFRYLGYMFDEIDLKEYPNDQSVYEAYHKGNLKKDSAPYKNVVNLVKYCQHNREAAQLIGFITLFRSSLKGAKGSNLSILIDKPETDLHPQRIARFMSMFYKMRDEYWVAQKT
jgi:hypothetical protein